MTRHRRPFPRVLPLLVLLGLGALFVFHQPRVEAQGAVRVRLGTVAPKDTLWEQVLQRMAQDWRTLSRDRIRVTIHPGGVLGDEVSMLRRVRLGQLQAVALSGAGLAQADKSVAALQIPMMIRSYEELDYVRARLEPELEKRLEAAGYIVLNWSDVGWVHFFSKTAARTPDDVRKMKLFISAGDPDSEALYRDFGVNPVPMAVTDMVPNLQTGLIDAFSVPPLFALSDQSFALAKHMIAVRWAPLIGATVMSTRAWQQIPDDLKPQLMTAARAAADGLQRQIRQQGEEAIEAMQEYGLEVTTVDAELEAVWQREAERAYPQLRDRFVPGDLFDEVRRLRDEFRRQQSQ